jgi:3-isopropylmalate/(R)-2-methylmalate dehydratase small subunit
VTGAQAGVTGAEAGVTAGGLVPVERRAGRAIAVRGDDIDTDRIIPARYMKAITFDGLERYTFQDARFDPATGAALPHPMNDPRFAGASVLVVNRNFGCGSSREHAPQSLNRWGIHALVGESFAEIFFGNCVSLGMPAVTLPADEIEQLMRAVEAHPGHEVIVDVARREVRYGDRAVPCGLPDGPRQQLLEGTWDATRTLLVAADAIRATAARLPYVTGF